MNQARISSGCFCPLELVKFQACGKENLEGVSNIFVFEDKLRAFLCKIDLLIIKVEEKNFLSFATLKALANNEDYVAVTDQMQHNILSH